MTDIPSVIVILLYFPQWYCVYCLLLLTT